MANSVIDTTTPTGHHIRILDSETNFTRLSNTTQPFPVRGDPYEPPHAKNLTHYFPYPRLKLVRHEEAAINGTSFGMNSRIFFEIKPDKQQKTCLLPLFLITFSLIDENPIGAGEGGGVQQGSWSWFEEQKLYINNIEIENLNHPEILTTYEVMRDRKDMGNNVFDSLFEPDHREYPMLGIFNLATRVGLRNSSNPGFIQPMIHELENPITRTKKVFPHSWFNLTIRIELKIRRNTVSTSPTASKYVLSRMKLVYYTVEGYHPRIRREIMNKGLFIGLRYISHHSKLFDRTGNFHYSCNEHTSSLDKLTMISIQYPPSPNIRFYDYVGVNENRIKEIQFYLNGEKYPQQPLSITSSYARTYEFVILSILGPIRSLNKYQKGANDINRGFGEILDVNSTGVLEFPFGVHAHDNRFSDGIDTKEGENALQIVLNREPLEGTNAVRTTQHMFFHKSGILIADAAGHVQWYK